MKSVVSKIIVAALLLGLFGLSAPALAQQQRSYAYGIVMVDIPAGSFTMGSCVDDEKSFFGEKSSCANPDGYALSR